MSALLTDREPPVLAPCGSNGALWANWRLATYGLNGALLTDWHTVLNGRRPYDQMPFRLIEALLAERRPDRLAPCKTNGVLRIQ